MGGFPPFFIKNRSVNLSKMHGMLKRLSYPFILVLFSLTGLSQGIQKPATPTIYTVNQINFFPENKSYNTSNRTTTQFSPSYKVSSINEIQNTKTKSTISQYSEIKKELVSKENTAKKALWKISNNGLYFANQNSAPYKLNHSFYLAAYDSINDMLSGKKTSDLKRAVFLVENAYWGNKSTYKQFSDLIDNCVYIVRQVIKSEKLDTNNNLALNYAIQKLFIGKVKYIDKKGVVKYHQSFSYDFEDPMGAKDYSKQFVFKALLTNSGQCHNLPLVYKLIADEIGAKASIAYSPNHSYITFPDNDYNYYNFECTSGVFTSYAFIMSSGYINSNAVMSGIYTIPATDQQLLATQLNDLGLQHTGKFTKKPSDYTHIPLK
jgi:hypothetical protein